MATGLAMNKKKVFIFSMIPFLTMRCYEHIKINICSHNLPIVLVKDGYTEKSEKEIEHDELISDFIGVEKIIEKYL